MLPLPSLMHTLLQSPQRISTPRLLKVLLLQLLHIIITLSLIRSRRRRTLVRKLTLSPLPPDAEESELPEAFGGALVDE